MQNFIPLEWALLILSVFNAVTEWTEKAWGTSREVWKAVGDVFRTKEYVFFADSGAAYLRSDTAIHATGSARPQWFYDLRTRTFYEWVGNESRVISRKPYSLPILSLDLKEGPEEPTHYDLTDFLETVKVMRATREGWCSPSLPQLLGAWSLVSGIVLDPRRFRAHVVTEAAEERELDIGDLRALDHVLSLEDGEIEETAGAGAGAGAGAAPTTEAAPDSLANLIEEVD